MRLMDIGVYLMPLNHNEVKTINREIQK